MREADRQWLPRAMCRDVEPEIFFPVAKWASRRAYLAELNAAREFCHRCPVAADCAAYAFRNGIMFGVWGGIDMERLPRHERVRMAALL